MALNKFIAILFLLCFLVACQDQKLSHRETVIEYYKSRNALNFNGIKTYVDTKLTITEGDYVMSYDTNSFYEIFRWDSVFQPSYEIIELEEKNNQVLVMVALNSLRNEFLQNNPLTCKYNISFHEGNISKIETLDCLNVDWNVWQKERDSLVDWIENNHPELNGFVHDMTMEGAKNYLKSIELYKDTDNH